MLRPAVLLRLESLLVLLVSAALFRHFRGKWMLFGLLFFCAGHFHSRLHSILVYTKSAYWEWRAYNSHTRTSHHSCSPERLYSLIATALRCGDSSDAHTSGGIACSLSG
jgi:hypothetical protein